MEGVSTDNDKIVTGYFSFGHYRIRCNKKLKSFLFICLPGKILFNITPWAHRIQTTLLVKKSNFVLQRQPILINL